MATTPRETLRVVLEFTTEVTPAQKAALLERCKLSGTTPGELLQEECADAVGRLLKRIYRAKGVRK